MIEGLTKEYLLSILNGTDLEIPNEAVMPEEDVNDNSVYVDPTLAVTQTSNNPTVNDSTENKQEVKNSLPTKFRELDEFLEVVTAAPTHTPKNINEQIKYCTADSKLYLYDTINKTWKKSAAFT